MFDIGGWEFLVIVLVALIVIGPKDLPVAIRAVTSWIGKARELAREFRGGLEELSREVELDSLQKDVRTSLAVDDLDRSAHSIRDEVDGVGREIEYDPASGKTESDESLENYSYYERPSYEGPAEEIAAPEDGAAPRALPAPEREAAVRPTGDGGPEKPDTSPAAAAGKAGA